MINEAKFPVTFRASLYHFFMCVVIVARISFRIGIVSVLNMLEKPGIGSVAVFLLLVAPLGIIYPLTIFTLKLKAMDSEFLYSSLFYKKIIKWSEITKVTAETGLYGSISVFHAKVKRLEPLQIGHLISNKSLARFLEILILKSPQAELGFGIEKFRKKYEKYTKELV